MFTWNVDELKLRNEKANNYAGKERIFNDELDKLVEKITKETKIKY